MNYTNSGTQHRISSYDWVIHGVANSTKNNGNDPRCDDETTRF